MSKPNPTTISRPSAPQPKLVAVLVPLVVVWAAAVFHLSTFAPSVSYPDALNYISGSISWASGEKVLPVNTPLSYEGWVAAIGLLPAARTVPVDMFDLMVSAKWLNILFTISTSLAMYLVADRLFRSRAFALLAAALLTVNPYVWFWGHGVMSDTPALSLMLFSLLFFIRFREDGSRYDLATSSLLLAFAAIVRIQSVILMVPYAIGLLSTSFFSGPNRPVKERVRELLIHGAIVGLFPAVFFYVMFGVPGRIGLTSPLIVPGLADLMTVFKWYVGRVAGWAWVALAGAGMAVGLARRRTRTTALMFVSFIAVGATYFASMNRWTPGDMPRYLIPTLPFTLLGIGFLWTSLRRAHLNALIALCAAVHVGIALPGFLMSQSNPAQEPPWTLKLLMIQNYLANDFANGYRHDLPDMLDDVAMGKVLPDGAVAVMPEGSLLGRHLAVRNRFGAGIDLIVLVGHLPQSERLREIPSIPQDASVFVFDGPDSASVESALDTRGFSLKGRVGMASYYLGPESRTEPQLPAGP